MGFWQTDDILRRDYEIKTDSINMIKAVKIHNEDEFNFLKQWTKEAKSSCGDRCEIKVEGMYEGPDWYFPESSHIDMGGWHEDKYWIESLGYKKLKFIRFCEEHDSVGDDSVVYSIQLPKVWASALYETPES